MRLLGEFIFCGAFGEDFYEFAWLFV